jgi:ribonuclease III
LPNAFEGIGIDDLKGDLMSRPRLHQDLNRLYSERSPELLLGCLHHPDFDRFKASHGLTLPTNELVQAFIHSSFAHEYQVAHQEQLEFLGDAVLQLILTEELYRRFPQEKEGQLSKLRSALVNEANLAILARGLGIGELLLVGRGEFIKQLFIQPAVLADTFEAILAQIYRHEGLEVTRKLFFGWLERFVPTAFEPGFLQSFDSKSQLQELSLARYKKLPRYESEPQGNGFEVKLWINEELLASGVFPSKKAGEKELAETVIKKNLI